MLNGPDQECYGLQIRTPSENVGGLPIGMTEYRSSCVTNFESLSYTGLSSQATCSNSLRPIVLFERWDDETSTPIKGRTWPLHAPAAITNFAKTRRASAPVAMQLCVRIIAQNGVTTSLRAEVSAAVSHSSNEPIKVRTAARDYPLDHVISQIVTPSGNIEIKEYATLELIR